MKIAWQNKIPSRLPPKFVEKTLERLLPSQSELIYMTRDQLLKVAAQKQSLEKLIVADPVRFFQPTQTGGQAQFMLNADPSIQGRYFFAANKTGKTTAGSIICGEIAEGKPLWNAIERKLDINPWLTQRPKRLCFFSEDFQTHEEAIVPTYATWIHRYVDDIVKGPSGNLTRIHHKNGSIIYLRTYDQGYAKAEGKDYDLVWCDEPPPRDVYTAIFRGLVATKGLLLITATLLAETWLYDEIRQPFVRSYEATMFDNTWLDASARENFARMLTDEERAIRIFGKPASLSGAIYPNFNATRPSPFIIEQQEPPWNPLVDKPWPIVLGVDPHERKPIYCAWAYVTPDNNLIWFDWACIPTGSIKSIFEALKKREATHEAPTTLVIGDPNRFVATQMDGQSWQTAFEEHEYPVLLGNDDLAHGHTVVRGMFDQPNTMFFTEAMQGEGGPVYSLARYTWDDWQRGTRFERGLKEKPKEKHKDFPDVIRYVAVALADNIISFESLSNEVEAISLIDEELRGNGNPYLN